VLILSSIFARRRWILTFAFLAALLPGCGGGDGGAGGDTGGSSNPPAPLISGVVKSAVKVLSAADVGAGGLQANEGGGARLSSSSPRVASLAVGDTVHVPAQNSPGLLMGFTGKVSATRTTSGATTIELMPALVEDVFDEVSWDLDTSKTGVQTLGIVSLQRPQQVLKAVPTGSGGLAMKDGMISGSFALERVFNYSGHNFTISASVDVQDVVVRSSAEFNPRKFGSSGGWGKIGAVVSGNISGTAKIKSEDDVTIPLGDALYKASAWDDLKWNAGRLFSMQGLEGTDKAGRIPLGGIVVIPAAGVAGNFTGNGGVDQAATLKALSVASAIVFWVYTDASGNISMNGELGVRADGGTFKFGRVYTLGGSDAPAEQQRSSLGKVTLLGGGEFDGTQRLGFSAAADVLIAGIRPLSTSAFAGFKATATGSGDAISVEVWPNPGATASRWACADGRFWAGVESETAFRVKAALGDGWLPVVSDSGVNLEYSHPRRWTLFDKGMFAGHNAVCEGAVLSRSTLDLKIGGIGTLNIVDGAGNQLLDFNLQKLDLPTRLKWVAANPSLATITSGPDGAVIKAIAGGTTDITVTDEETGWTKKATLNVGVAGSITISKASCALDPNNPYPAYPRYQVGISGTARGPVGSYVTAYTNLTNGVTKGQRMTSCGAWSSTFGGWELYCQRGPDDPEETTYTGAYPLGGDIADDIYEARAVLVNTGGPAPTAIVPLTCN